MGNKDAVDTFTVAETFLSTTSSWQSQHKEALQEIGARILLPASSQSYFQSHIDLYMRVPERPIFDAIYGYLNELNNASVEKESVVRCVVQFIALQFEKQRLTLDNVRKYIGKEEADNLRALLERSKQVS